MTTDAMAHNLAGQRKRNGAKLPLTPEHYKRLRRLIRGSNEAFRERNLLLLNFQTNTSLRASDVLKLTVGDVYREGKFLDKFWVRQQKTQEPAAVTILDCMLRDLKAARKSYESLFYPSYFDEPDNPLFPSRKRRAGRLQKITYATYLTLFKAWVSDIGLNPDQYGTHSLRATIPAEYYRKTRDVVGASKMFGHSNIQTTSIYLNEVAKDIAQEYRQTFFFDD